MALRTAFYIDGQNLSKYAKKFCGPSRDGKDIDPAKIAKSIADSDRHIEVAKVSYFTGIPGSTEGAAWRAKEIHKLNILAQQGVTTYSNDLQRGLDNKLHEIGVDVRMGAAIIEDLFTKRYDRFVLVTNDQDFEPIVRAVQSLAKKINHPIEVFNAVTGSSNSTVHSIPGSQKVVLHDSMIQRSIIEWNPLMETALKNFEEDRTMALDASLHERRRTPEALKEGPADGVVFLLDLQSLGKTAKENFKRTHLDANLHDLMYDVAQKKDWNIVGLNAYSCIHQSNQNLEASLIVSTTLKDLADRKWRTQAFTYGYHKMLVARNDRGPGTTEKITAVVPREKRIHATILTDAIKLASHKDVKALVIVSDDPNLWPIVETTKRIAKAYGRDLRVIHSRMNDHIDCYQGAEPHIIDENTYVQHIEKIDRRGRVDAMAETILNEDFQKLDTQVRTFYAEPNYLLNPSQAEGSISGQTVHWSSVFQKDGSVAVYRNTTLPFLPTLNSRYRIIDSGRSMETLAVDQVLELDLKIDQVSQLQR